MNPAPPPQARILRVWAPLAATWLMMAVEGPFLAAVIARLPGPTVHLAAYGVAFAFALILEAPVIMMMTAATALVRERESYLELRRFTAVLNVLLTLLMAVLLLPGVFEPLARAGIGLPPDVARATRRALSLLLPWPAAIGFRRFYQGVLIAEGMARRVAYGTVARIAAMAAAAVLLAWRAPALGGSAVAALALSTGVVTEAAAARAMAARAVRRLLSRRGSGGAPLGLRGLLAFYLPLALTSLLALGVQPVVTFFVGHARMAIASLAALPVVMALVFVFRALGLAFQEVAIALAGDRLEGLPALSRFALWLGLALSGGLALVTLTPLSRLWFRDLSGLGAGLTAVALPAARLMVPVPGLTVLLCLERAVLVVTRRTAPVTWATALEVGVIVAVLWTATVPLAMAGATAAGLALLAGRLASTAYLGPALAGARRAPV